MTWRRAQMVLLSAQGMDAAAIAKVAFTSEDRVRDVIRNFSAGRTWPARSSASGWDWTAGTRPGADAAALGPALPAGRCLNLTC